MNIADEWIGLADALDHISSSAGSIHLSRIYLRTALSDGRIRSKAKCVFVKHGALPKEMIDQASIPDWFWKHARINWDDLTAPAVHSFMVINGYPTRRLPYLEAHIISVNGVDLLKIWPQMATAASAESFSRETGYAVADRALYSEIEHILRTGRARGANGAAKLLVDRIVGDGTPDSRAKRLSDRFNRDRRGAPQ